MDKYLVICNGRVVSYAYSYSDARNDFRRHVRKVFSRKRRIKRSSSYTDMLYRNPCLKDYPRYKIIPTKVFNGV